MKHIPLYFMLIISTLMLQSASCTKVKELDYKGIKRTELQTLSLKNAALRIELAYYNPNKFGLDVKETNLSIYLNNKFVAIADQPQKTQVPREAEFTFPIVAHFDPLKVIGTAISSIFSKSNKLTIQGTAKVGKGGIYIKLPVNITEEVSLYSK